MLNWNSSNKYGNIVQDHYHNEENALRLELMSYLRRAIMVIGVSLEILDHKNLLSEVKKELTCEILGLKISDLLSHTILNETLSKALLIICCCSDKRDPFLLTKNYLENFGELFSKNDERFVIRFRNL